MSGSLMKIIRKNQTEQLPELRLPDLLDHPETFPLLHLWKQYEANSKQAFLQQHNTSFYKNTPGPIPG